MLIFAPYFTYSIGYSFSKDKLQLYKDIIDLYVLNINGMIKDEDNIGAEDALKHIYEHTNIKDNIISNVLENRIIGNCFYKDILRITMNGEFVVLSEEENKENTPSNEIYYNDMKEVKRVKNEQKSVIEYEYCHYINTHDFESNRMGLSQIKLFNTDDVLKLNISNMPEHIPLELRYEKNINTCDSYMIGKYIFNILKSFGSTGVSYDTDVTNYFTGSKKGTIGFYHNITLMQKPDINKALRLFQMDRIIIHLNSLWFDTVSSFGQRILLCNLQ